MWICCPGIAGQRQQRPSYDSAFCQISCAGGKSPHGFGRGIIFWKGNISFFVVKEGLVWEVLIYSVSILLPGTFHTTETKHSSKTNCHCNPTHVGPSSSL